jgi:hypothetical protein
MFHFIKINNQRQEGSIDFNTIKEERKKKDHNLLARSCAIPPSNEILYTALKSG